MPYQSPRRHTALTAGSSGATNASTSGGNRKGDRPPGQASRGATRNPPSPGAGCAAERGPSLFGSPGSRRIDDQGPDVGSGVACGRPVKQPGSPGPSAGLSSGVGSTPTTMVVGGAGRGGAPRPPRPGGAGAAPLAGSPARRGAAPAR